MIHKLRTSLLPLLAALVMVLLTVRGVAGGPPVDTPGRPLTSAAKASLQAGGSGTIGGDLLLSTFESFDYNVAVAYNSNAQEFLAVWSHNGDLYGQIYDGQGVPQGENLLIDDSGQASISYPPAVAYSLASDRYLVVSDRLTPDRYDIYGQFVDADGSLLGTSFVLDNRAGDQLAPDVTSDGSGFLAVWHGDDGSGTAAIYGRGVTGSGIVSPVTLTIASGGGKTRKEAAVAFNETAAEYLVVFRRYDAATPGEIAARRVAQDGSLPGAEYAISGQHYAESPDLAATPWGATGGYVVVWNDSRSSDSDIYGRVVLAGSDNSFDGGDFVICNAGGNQLRPAIARSPASGQFLVVWEDWRAATVSSYDIYGQRLTNDANLAGANFAISAVPAEQWYPAIAAAQSPDAYLVLWEDRRVLPYQDIYGQRIASNGSLLGYEFAVSAQPEPQSAPAVAYDPEGKQYLAVWQDQRNGHWAIYGQRFSAGDGWPLEQPWAIEADGHDNVQPAVAYSEDEQLFVVVWADEDLDKLEGRQVPPAGQATVLFSVLDSDGGRHPALAYDDNSNRFLVAWDDGSDVYARALNGEGFPIGGDSTLVAGGEGVQQYPSVVLNTDTHLFLVAWETHWNDVRLYGYHLDQNANLSGPPFLIAGGDGVSRYRPALAYDSNTDRYLAVYEYQVASKEFDIYGQLLNSSGAQVGAELVIRNQPAGADQLGPDVFYVPDAGQYYVIWAEYQDPGYDYDLYGRWLDAAGSPASSLLPFFRYAGEQIHPQMAYDPDHGQGLVVWEDTRRSKSGDVYGRLGALDLEPPTALFTRDPTVGPAGTTFVFNAQPSHDNLTPPGALRVRWDWTSNGSWDTPLSYNKVVSQTVLTPGVYTVTLEVWDMMWLTDTISLPIYVLSAGGNTPPVAALSVTPLIGTAGQNFQLNASASTDAETPGNLQFRWDWENDGTFDTGWSTVQIRNHTFDDAGLHLARVEVKDGGGLTDAAVRAFLVLPGDVVTLEIVPSAATVLPGEVIHFRAIAWDTYGNRMSNPSVNWSVLDVRAGVIDASGVFTASNRAGTYADVVRAYVPNDPDDRATVTIFYPYPVYLPLVSR